jgi:hypothetical protein
VFDFLDIAEPVSDEAAAFATYGVRYTCHDEDNSSCQNKVLVGPPATRGWATS